MVANATLALDAILLKYPGPLRLVSILVSYSEQLAIFLCLQHPAVGMMSGM